MTFVSPKSFSAAHFKGAVLMEDKMNSASTNQTGSERVDLSFLFISYARADLLCQAVRSVKEALNDVKFTYEFVIADDHSPEPHATLIRGLEVDKLVVSERNRGLGANCNSGLAACSGDFIVQIQDDWKFVGGPEVFDQALRIFSRRRDIGLIRLTNPSSLLELPHDLLSECGVEIEMYENDGIKGLRRCSDRPYSDQPHIKRRALCDHLGPYCEGSHMGWTELDFQSRVANQTQWKVAGLRGKSKFLHCGAERSFNPVYRREKLIRRIGAIPLIGPLFNTCRPMMRAVRDLLRPSRRIRR